MRLRWFGWLATAFAAAVACGLPTARADEWLVDRPDLGVVGARLSGLQLSEAASYDERGNEFWPSLMVRCAPGDMEIAINWQIPVRESDGRASVLTRLDDASPRVERWLVAQDARVTEKPDPGAWLRRLLAAEKLSARTLSDTGTTISTVFDLAGLPALAEEMAGTCGWNRPAEKMQQRRPR